MRSPPGRQIPLVLNRGSCQNGAMRLRIVEDDLTGPEAAALLGLHLGEMHGFTPPASVRAMPLERLRAPASA